MEHRPWETNDFSANQEITRFMEPGGSFLCSQAPANWYYPEPEYFMNHFNIIFQYVTRTSKRLQCIMFELR